MTDITQNKINHLLDKFEQKRGKIDLSLGRIIEFLKRTGNPVEKLPPVIHFAGTNGKGSTIAFLKAMITASGKTCHAYTSPHLVRFNERIEILGNEINNQLLLEVLEEVDASYEKHKHEIELTFFELTTIVAFIAFSRVPADYILLETGMGGRYDATNLIAQPLLTVITPISFDHMEFLGNTIREIAGEKAGIIKQNVTCISAPQVEEAANVIAENAKEKNAPLVIAEQVADLPELSLKGKHQQINASTAIAAAREIGIGEEAIRRGLVTAKWRARMQKLESGHLVSLIPADSELWLDGAHNKAGAEVLRDFITQYNKPVYLITAMMNTKDAKSYFSILKGLPKGVFTIPIPGEPKCYSAQELADIATSAGVTAIPAANAAEAINQIKSPAGIFICGSLYLAGKILEENQ